MSTNRVGRANRIARRGISVWPPAITRASSSRARIRHASARVVGLTYSNGAGFMAAVSIRSMAHRCPRSNFDSPSSCEEAGGDPATDDRQTRGTGA